MLEITLTEENPLVPWGPLQGEVRADALRAATFAGPAEQISYAQEMMHDTACRAVCEDCAQESDACMTLGTVRGMNGYWLCAWCKLDQMGPGMVACE